MTEQEVPHVQPSTALLLRPPCAASPHERWKHLATPPSHPHHSLTKSNPKMSLSQLRPGSPLPTERQLLEWREECSRKCLPTLSGLAACRRANKGHPEACRGVQAQATQCHAEMACPAAAADYEACLQRAATEGGEPASACAKPLAAMKKCLREAWLYPFNTKGLNIG
ncbi:hypothetical protein ABPG75_008945 [Micractinium tetrahymenae]